MTGKKTELDMSLKMFSIIWLVIDYKIVIAQTNFHKLDIKIFVKLENTDTRVFYLRVN